MEKWESIYLDYILPDFVKKLFPRFPLFPFPLLLGLLYSVK